MVGPINGGAQGAEVIRLIPDRGREGTPDARSGQEVVSRDGAATEEARGNRAAIVQAAESLVGELRAQARKSRSHLRIERDEETGHFRYQSVDTETGEILQEWPREDVRLALETLNQLRGALIDQSI